MDRVYRSGQMERSIKDAGKIIKHMDKEYFGMFMVINTKATGKEIKLTDMENIPIVTEPHTRVIGEMICNTDVVLNIGTITQNTKDSIKKERNMV
jgi:hypothetical protein